VHRPPIKARSTLKVVVFNAAGGRSLSKLVNRLGRPPLRGADIILLCEAGWQLKLSYGREIARDLAQELGLSLALMTEFATSGSSKMLRGSMGNAILSGQPLSRVVGASSHLVAQAVFNGRSITLGVAHLNSRWHPAGREGQMKEFLARLPRHGPALIGGDFNTTTVGLRTRAEVLKAILLFLAEPRRLRHPQTWEPLFERLAESDFEVRDANVCGKPTFTFSRMIPPMIRPKLDWIASRGLDPIPGSAVVTPARTSFFGHRFSDHDFVVCDVHI
jgi:hypothetical protein